MASSAVCISTPQVLSSTTAVHEENAVIVSGKMTLSVRKQPSARGNKLVQSVRPLPKQKVLPNIFKYKICSGNNGRLLLVPFRKRPWWHGSSPSEANDGDSAISGVSFLWEMYRNPHHYRNPAYATVVINHLENNSWLVTKKGLYLTVRDHCVKVGLNMADVVPRTYYLASVKSCEDDFEAFMQYNQQKLGLQPLAIPSCSANQRSASVFDVRVETVSDDVPHSLEPIAGAEEAVAPQSESPVSAKLRPLDKSTEEGLVWILKPASKTNRGFGIKVVRGVDAVLEVVHAENLAAVAAEAEPQEPQRTAVALEKAANRRAAQNGWIVQEYMERPLLVAGRKFDIRCYVLIVQKGAELSAYFYEDAYIRTSSKKYTLGRLSDRETHLTNDAVQKHSKCYGKFEQGNKLSLAELQQSIANDYPRAPANVVEAVIMPRIKQLSALSVAAAKEKLLETQCKRSFELLGYDYMIDEQFRPVLIEINSNPCLELCCPLLAELIPAMLNAVIKVAVDPFFPPPTEQRTRSCEEAVASLATEDCRFTPLQI